MLFCRLESVSTWPFMWCTLNNFFKKDQYSSVLKWILIFHNIFRNKSFRRWCRNRRTQISNSKLLVFSIYITTTGRNTDFKGEDSWKSLKPWKNRKMVIFQQAKKELPIKQPNLFSKSTREKVFLMFCLEMFWILNFLIHFRMMVTIWGKGRKYLKKKKIIWRKNAKVKGSCCLSWNSQSSPSKKEKNSFDL